MFPYRDDNPTLRTPIVTIGLIVITCVVWVVVQGAGSALPLARSICELGLIPGEVLGRVRPGTEIPLGGGMVCRLEGGGGWFTALTSMFLHGGWLHLIGNMWFLWIFGNNVEDSMGRGRFLGFYVLCGLLAAVAQVLVNPSSPIPMVGASGAISGVMGAYLILYPKVRVHLLVFLGFFITTVSVPAYFMLVYWALLQAMGSVPMLSEGGSGGGVAFLAHLGGFVTGAASIKLFAREDLVEEHQRIMRRPRVQFRQFSGDRWYG